MKEHITSLGWNYIGSCNCGGGNWNKYSHHDIQGYQIRLGKDGIKFEIRLHGRGIRKAKEPIFISTYEQIFNNIPTIN